jgi:hypothetical protein
VLVNEKSNYYSHQKKSGVFLSHQKKSGVFLVFKEGKCYTFEEIEVIL